MIHLRPFRNDDPPALSEIWRSQPAQRRLVQPMTEPLWDEVVLCKPYFDRHGLIVAEADGRAMGFAQCSMGPNEERDRQGVEEGTISLIMVRPGDDAEVIGRQLLTASEAYLRQQGARQILGGEIGREAPFYLGLYGGCMPPGILRSDTFQTQLYEQASYDVLDQRVILERTLGSFRPPADREIMQLRRRHQTARGPGAAPQDWWAACTWGQLDAVQFELKQQTNTVAAITFWDMEPLASSWGVHAMGLLEWQVEACLNEAVVLTYLLGESMREMQSHGVTAVEVQSPPDATPLLEASKRLGFEEVDQGIRYRRTSNANDSTIHIGPQSAIPYT